MIGRCLECGKHTNTKRLGRDLHFVDRDPGGGTSAYGKYCNNCRKELLDLEYKNHDQYVHRPSRISSIFMRYS